MTGGDQDNRVTLRLAADNWQIVQVDLGADGTPQFSFARTSIAAIDLKGGTGDDVLKIDDANGVPRATSEPRSPSSQRCAASSSDHRSGD